MSICPGHAIEVAAFMLEDTLSSDDKSNRPVFVEMLTWALEAGWDPEFGGIYHFVDEKGNPTDRLWGTTKIWWAQAEALTATLLAFAATEDTTWLDWHEKIHAYVRRHFVDPKYGEWFAQLSREGIPQLGIRDKTISRNPETPPKGDLGKSGFHVMRMLIGCRTVAGEAAKGLGRKISIPLVR